MGCLPHSELVCSRLAFPCSGGLFAAESRRGKTRENAQRLSKTAHGWHIGIKPEGVTVSDPRTPAERGDPASCFAIESNPLTRRMYEINGISAAPYSARLVGRLVARQ